MAERTSIDKITAVDTDSTEDATTDAAALQTLDTDNELAETSDDEMTSDDTSDEAEQIREQIVETRRGMSETIDAIQEKLSFSNISEQVKDQVSEQISGAVETAKDALFGKAGDIVNTVGKQFKAIGGADFAKKAQDNPAALAIIGAGIGALLVGVLFGGKKNKKKTASYRYKTDSYDYNYNSDDDEVRYTDTARRELKSDETKSAGSQESTVQTAQKKIGDAAGSAYETVSEAASTAYAGVTNAASSAYESVGSAAGKTYESVGNIAGKTYKSVGSAAGYAYDKAGVLGGQAMKNYDYYIEENPLAVGAVALALGAAIGFAIPLTRTENEYMGEYRDNVLEKAQATAQEAIGSVKQMASEAQKAITEEVKSKTA